MSNHEDRIFFLPAGLPMARLPLGYLVTGGLVVGARPMGGLVGYRAERSPRVGQPAPRRQSR